MELTKKQIILILAISGAILLLTAAAVLIFTPGDDAAAPEPAATVPPTDTPLASACPTDTPIPTVFRLPLVPQGDTPQPSKEPAAGIFAPYGTAPAETEGPWVDAYKQ